MARATKWTYPQDEVAAAATWTVETGTLDANTPIARLTDGAPANGIYATSTSLGLMGQMAGGAQLVDVVHLCHIAADAGLVIRIQANTVSGAWGGALPIDVTVPLGSLQKDGYYEDIVIRLSDATYGLSAGTRTKEYWRILFPTGTILPKLGEVLMYSTHHGFPTGQDIAWGFKRPQQYGITRHVTSGSQAMKYHRAPRIDAITGQATVLDDGLAALINWRAAARAQNFTLMPDDGRNTGMLCEFLTEKIEPTHLAVTRSGGQTVDAWTVPLELQQISRGFPWIDPDL